MITHWLVDLGYAWTSLRVCWTTLVLPKPKCNISRYTTTVSVVQKIHKQWLLAQFHQMNFNLVSFYLELDHKMFGQYNQPCAQKIL